MKILKRKSLQDALGLFILLRENRELRDSEPYMLNLYILVDPEEYDETSLDLSDAFEEICDILEDYNINVVNVDLELNLSSGVHSTKSMSLYEFTKLKKWDFEYLSYSTIPPGKVLP